jgi:hypothetical protein
VYYVGATLDGRIAEADDDRLIGYEGSFEGDDADPGPMSEVDSHEDFYAGVGALVSGSTTYEWVHAHLGADGLRSPRPLGRPPRAAGRGAPDARG